MKLREAFLFLLASFALCACFFEGGLWGAKLLAPLDIAPALFGHYRYLDPATTGVPANHHIVDQVSQDLPLQFTTYHAVRRGEMPWWDPYTTGGRPLLADAHLNGSDPLRVLAYLTMPTFELAYNWTRVLQSVMGALGLFLLLRQLGFSPLIAGGWALTGQAAACHALYFGHPWIQGSFVYYPWLWLVWNEATTRPKRWHILAAAGLVAGIFTAGNLQSHAYLPIFAGLYCLTGPFTLFEVWERARRLAPGLILGALLAAPFLLPELELFKLNQRIIAPSHAPPHLIDWLSIPAAVYPWVGGTIRTFNYRDGLTFNLFIGSAAVVLAACGALAELSAQPAWRFARRLSLALIGFYAVVISTPLDGLLYARIAGLPTLGMVVLAAIGLAAISEAPRRFRLLLPVLVAMLVLIPLGSYAVAWWIYPRYLEPKAAPMMLAHASDDLYGGLSRPLREAEVRDFPHEITFANFETLAAWLALAALAFSLAARLRSSRPLPRAALLALLAVNLVSPVLYMHRSVPRADRALWERLRDGGPEQQRVAAALRPSHLRLDEASPAEFAGVMPADFAHFYGVHTTAGYYTLKPLSMAFIPNLDPALLWDYRYVTPAVGATGTLEPRPWPGQARFSWIGDPQRPVRIAEESLDRLTVEFPPGPAGRLLRTDTFYPGWTATDGHGEPLALEKHERIFTTVSLPEGATRVVFQYQPTGWRGALLVSAAALLAALATLRWRVLE